MRKQYFIPQTEQLEIGAAAYLCQMTSTNEGKAPGGVQLAPKKNVF